MTNNHSHNSTNPHHTHDCETCQYLGSTLKNGKPVDLYFHFAKGRTNTVIARYSSKPSDYESNLLFPKYFLQDYLANHPENKLSNVEILRLPSFTNPVFEAAARSIELNLIDKDLNKASIFTSRTKP